MFDKKNHDQDDALRLRIERLGQKLEPSGELMQAAINGAPLRGNSNRYTAGYHVGKFAKAVIAYAVGVALLLGTIWLLPRLFSESAPVATQPDETTIVTTDNSLSSERDVLVDLHQYNFYEMQVLKQIWASIKDQVDPQLTINDISIGSFIYPINGGYVCFYYGCPGEPSVHEEIIWLQDQLIDSLLFKYDSETSLSVIKNGNFCSLRTAYENGLLTKEELTAIWEAYRTSEEYAWLYEITDERMGLINALLNKYQAPPHNNSSLKYIVRGFDACDLIACPNGYVLTLSAYEDVPCMEHVEYIGGYEFRHSDLIELDYYTDGNFYKLKDAYDSGMVTDGVVRAVWKEFYDRHKNRYTTQYDYKQSIQDANPHVPISFDTSNDGFHEGRLLADTDRLLADMDWIVLNDYLEVVWCNEGDIADYTPLFDGDQSTVYEESSSYRLKLASKDGKALTVHGMIVTWSNHTHNAVYAKFRLGNAEDTPYSLFMGDDYVPPIGTYIDVGCYELFTIPVTTVNFELDWDMVIDISGDQSFNLSIFMDEELAIYMGLDENYTVDIVLYGTVN